LVERTKKLGENKACSMDPANPPPQPPSHNNIRLHNQHNTTIPATIQTLATSRPDQISEFSLLA
jgi:hypothetical protein